MKKARFFGKLSFNKQTIASLNAASLGKNEARKVNAGNLPSGPSGEIFCSILEPCDLSCADTCPNTIRTCASWEFPC